MQRPHDERDLQQIYSTRFAQRTGYRLQVWKVLAAYFGQWVPPDGTVLDLGAGYCEFINLVRSGTKYAMDLNPEVHKRAASEVKVLQQDCSESWPFAGAGLDTVFTSNFLEHLADKNAVRRTLMNAHKCLKPGGRFIALGPNMKYIGGAYWDFFDHYVELTELSLCELLINCGFEVEKQVARFLPYTMSHGRQYPVFMLRMYLAMPAFWPLFGKQFLVIGRKPLNGPPQVEGVSSLAL